MECLNCKFQNPEGMKFCGECGTLLSFDKETFVNPITIEAERKRVTALFSDLTGYTAMASVLDPEEVKGIMNTIFDGMKKIVFKFGGFIEHSAGDSVLALFGVPKAHEDDPVRAVNAAKEIHAFVESLSFECIEKEGISLSMHSGINTGLAVTADVNQEKGTHKVTGDVINVASRLSSVAKAGEIIVGPETFNACVNTIAFNTRRPVNIKGKAVPVVVHQVAGAKTTTPQKRVDRQVFSEMVGRDNELDKLEIQVLKVINGQGSVVNIFGEAGIGKSRLIAELKKKEAIKRVVVIEGRSISIGKNLSFHPIIDLIKQWAKISKNDSTSQALTKLEVAIKTVHPEESDEIIPFIATLMGMKLTGEYARRMAGITGDRLEKLIQKNIRELLIKGSQITPMVLIMEDLHWADESSISLLDTLYGFAENQRLLFINIFRPGYLSGDTKKVRTVGKRLPVYYLEIEILPLENQDSEQLINCMLDRKGLPYAVRKQITARAGGNPFFIEEVIRFLIDDRIIVKTETGFQISEKINTAIIPPTLNDVLIARIDRLEERTREVIKIASVIGRNFFDRIIKDVADSIEDLDRRLTNLKDIQLIRDRVRMQEIEHLFKHALAQEATYESILIQQRKQLHLKVAQSIERVFHDRLHEFYGTIAHHYSMAENEEKAEEYLLKAGEEALKVSASSEALHYYRDAMKLYMKKYQSKVNAEKMAGFEENIAFALMNKGYSVKAIPHFSNALELLGVKQHKSRTTMVFGLIYNLLFIIRYLYLPVIRPKKNVDRRDEQILKILYERSKAYMQSDVKKVFSETVWWAKRSLQLNISNSKLLIDINSSMPALFSWTGISFKISKKLLNYTENQLLISSKNHSPQVYYELSKLLHNLLCGNWESIKYNEKIVSCSLKDGDTFSASNYLIFVCNIYCEQGEFEQVKKIIAKLKNICVDYNDARAKAMALQYQALLFKECGQLTKALHAIKECIAISEKIGQEDRRIFGFTIKGDIQILQNDLERANVSLETARDLIAIKGTIPPFYRIRYLIVVLSYYIDRLTESVDPKDNSTYSDYRNQAVQIGKKLLKIVKKDATKRTCAYRHMGKYYWMTDQQDKALKAWTKALKEGERIGARLDLSRTYFEVGKRLLEPHSKYKTLNGTDASGFIQLAKTHFTELALKKDLHDLEKLKVEYGI